MKQKNSDFAEIFRKYGFPVLLLAVTFTVHWIVGSDLRMLNMSHDEMGVLGCAALLTGENWSTVVSEIGYYGYGSALLYVPVFMITKGAFLRYRLIVFINSCLMSLVPVLAYRLSVRWLKIKSPAAFGISLAAGLYPGYLLFSKWVWNETMMCLLPWVLVLVMFRLFHEEKKSAKTVWSIVLAFTLVYSYAVHSRSVGIIAAVFLVAAVILIFRRKLIAEPVSFTVSFAVFWVLNSMVKNWFVHNLWLAADGGQLNNTMGGSVGKISTYMTADGFYGMLRIAAGQFSAAVMSSYGLLVILFAAVPFMSGFFARKKEEAAECRAEQLLYAVSLLFFLAAFGISVIFLGVEGSSEVTRGDYFIYTRYFSNTLGIVVFAALVYLEKHGLKIRGIVFSAAAAALSALPLIMLADDINGQTNISNATILNLLAYLGENHMRYVEYADINLLLKVSLGVFAGVLILHRLKGALYIVLPCVFAWNFFVTGADVLVPVSEKNSGFVRVPAEALALNEDISDRYKQVYYYDVHQRKPWSSSAMQFALGEFRLAVIGDEINDEYDVYRLQDEISENSIIISTEDLQLDSISGSFYRLDEPYLNSGLEYIWVYGDEIKAFMEQTGRKFVY